ncbi:MAG: cytochrome b N-terminal domain-containing protein [bacterium]
MKSPPFKIPKLPPNPMKTFLDWLVETEVWKSIYRVRTPFDTTAKKTLVMRESVWLHLLPSRMPENWVYFNYSYFLGVISFYLFLLLTVTGMLLMLYYRPTVDLAYRDMLDFKYGIVPYGMFMRNAHRWGAQVMVISVMFHMLRVFYSGGYKPPRQFNWIFGVILLVLTLLLSYTGYLLPWDQLALWAVTVGANMGSYAPILGYRGPFSIVDQWHDARFVLIGGTSIGQATLIRFYVLHCVILPVFMAFFISFHLWRVRKDEFSYPIDLDAERVKEVAEEKAAAARAAAAAKKAAAAAAPTPQPQPAETISNGPLQAAPMVPGPDAGDTFKDSLEWMRKMREKLQDPKLIPKMFVWPHFIIPTTLVFVATTVLVGLMSILFDAPLEEMANPALTPNPSKAPWYFVGLQELLIYFDPWIAGVVLPSVIILGLMLVPYVDPTVTGIGNYPLSKKAWKERPFAMAVFTFGFISWFIFILIGQFIRGPNQQWYWPWENRAIEKTGQAHIYITADVWLQCLTRGETFDNLTKEEITQKQVEEEKLICSEKRPASFGAKDAQAEEFSEGQEPRMTVVMVPDPYTPTKTNLKEHPTWWTTGQPLGWGLILGFFGFFLAVPAVLSPKLLKMTGLIRYPIIMVLFASIVGVWAKIFLRLTFSIKYIVETPWFNI